MYDADDRENGPPSGLPKRTQIENANEINLPGIKTPQRSPRRIPLSRLATAIAAP
jgi:hypothetical protein